MGKHKRKHSEADETDIPDEHSNERMHKKKKKHKKEKDVTREEAINGDSTKQSQSDIGAESMIMDNIEDGQVKDKQYEKKKKKKKKHQSKECVEDDITRNQSLEDSVPKRKSKEPVSMNSVSVETDDAHGKKKKKNKHKDIEVEDKRFDEFSGKKSDNLEENKSEVVEQFDNTKGEDRKKKKKKHSSSNHDRNKDETNIGNGVGMNIETVQTPDKTKKKKKKLKKSEDEEDVCLKKSMDKKEICSDSPSTSATEFPQKSGPSPFAGQWNTASLGDNDRQNKFFRLLGGFKKDSNKPAIASKFNLGAKCGNMSLKQTGDSGKAKVRANTAMDKRQQEEYTKNMEQDYNRALSMNFNRGIGLGFEKPPEEGKKFYIDTNKSKSVKFDDSD